jgi:hypothetical protein
MKKVGQELDNFLEVPIFKAYGRFISWQGGSRVNILV